MQEGVLLPVEETKRMSIYLYFLLSKDDCPNIRTT